MLETIASAVTGLQAASELATGLLKLRDTAAIQTKVAELNSVIIAAQRSALAANVEQLALLEEIRSLKEKVVQMEAWAAEKQRYELTDYGCGTFARSLKPAMANGEPFHRICAQCYEQGRKGMLHSHGTFSDGREQVECLACSKTMMLGCDRGDRQTSAYYDYDPL